MEVVGYLTKKPANERENWTHYATDTVETVRLVVDQAILENVKYIIQLDLNRTVDDFNYVSETGILSFIVTKPERIVVAKAMVAKFKSKVVMVG